MERVLNLREDGRGFLKDFMKEMKVQLSVEKVDWIAEVSFTVRNTHCFSLADFFVLFIYFHRCLL